VSYDFEDLVVTAPLLSEEDVFNSHPALGKIAYRLPSIEELFKVPIEQLDNYDSLGFRL